MALNCAQTSPPTRKDSAKIPAIDSVIYLLRGERVILDADLAKIYGVETKALNQAVKRNRVKFPSDFHFHLTNDEADALNPSQVAIAHQAGTRTMRSQIVTASKRNLRHLPFAFTEHDAIMAANILTSTAGGADECLRGARLHQDARRTHRHP